jgi:hypothetical protein
MRRIALFFALCPTLTFAGKPTPCVTAQEASRSLNKDICISAHIYDVVELPDGTRFLDVCPPEVTDAECRFTIVSLQADRESVGELTHYRDANVHIRGLVQPIHGRAAIVLSHERQLRGGPPKFRPNPKLLHGFAGDDERPAIRDPNLRAQGGTRSFMNPWEQEPAPSRTARQK